MDRHCINIATSGLSLKVSDELKTLIRNLISNKYDINWVNISNIHIDLLLINENFFDSDNIQNILQKKKCPYLKISKTPSKNGYQVDEHTLHLPLEKVESLLSWIEINLLSYLNKKNTAVVSDLSNEPLVIDDKFIRNLHSPENARLHIFDDKGTLAIIDNRTQIAWLEPSRQHTQTNQSFNFTFANTSDFTKVSRKKDYYLQDWLWNLIWNSNNFENLASKDSYFKIDHWPQPYQKEYRKVSLQLSACFIQGAKITDVANQLNLSIDDVLRFVTACLMANNGKFVSASKCTYTPNLYLENSNTENHFFKNFIGKIRRRFGL
ncbi:hypothetical protein APC42_02565 [Acinetobacter pittii]|uniref:hypothetical protein n=2 Tax=Acinetobacter pittii TaxID=48296 RepID=UPI00070FB587|nr:hypothetical protein [Acinetobacter pittii]KRI49313.1 hypothetical protein APC42_02565 [Acinetobacter pittii]MCK0925736.1 hypothetical protein [Acinetobacter pittii]OTL80294.1 hypothetical protein B9X62_18555 [Acinetobacter pittii]WEE10830.1 hypothetical protein PX335_16475 [Acinetobacter pittii]